MLRTVGDDEHRTFRLASPSMEVVKRILDALECRGRREMVVESEGFGDIPLVSKHNYFLHLHQAFLC